MIRAKITLMDEFINRTYSKVVSLKLSANPDSRNKAVLVEGIQEGRRINYVVRNVLHFLGPVWGIHIFHMRDNKKITQWFKDVPGIEFTEISCFTNRKMYDKILDCPLFLKALNADKILLFQPDIIIRKKFNDEFLQWDYIGAPWEKNAKWNTPDFSGGGGGVTLRSVDVFIKAVTEKKHELCRGLFTRDDIFCAHSFPMVGGKVAPREVCGKFSVESDFTTFTQETFAMHAIHRYLTKEQQRQILSGISYE